MIAAAVTDIKPARHRPMSPPHQPGNSRRVSSTQQGIHPRLPSVLRRHLGTQDRTPIADHNRRAFETLWERLAAEARPLVLDSFCGTGYSTAQLAARHPDHLVVGIDKSAHRVARHRRVNDRDYLLLRAECEPLWTLLARSGTRLDYHYLLYPNPWPKPAQLRRRVHGHPAFAALLQLGGRLELRSNWQLYVEEFGVAAHLAGHPGRVSMLPAEGADAADLSLFERKYRRSGHTLWRFRADLERRAGPP
jgi:tRNA G46 methylase TrmB